MKRVIKLSVAAVSCMLLSCSAFVCDKAPEKSKVPGKFEISSLKGNALTFENVEAGTIYISKKNAEKMLSSDDEGNPKYMTEDLVSDFKAGTTTSMKEGNGFTMRFTVPEIEKGDYAMIDAEITLPQEVSIGDHKSNILPGSFNYNSKNSGHTEYIWFFFAEDNKSMYVKGKWNLSLYNKEKLILSQDFIVE